MENLKCEACDSQDMRPLFEKDGYPYQKCADCGLIRIYPQLSDAERDAINNGYFINQENSDSVFTDIKRKTFSKLLDMLPASNCTSPRLLDIGASKGIIMDVARSRGYDVYGIEASRSGADVIMEKFGADRVINGYFDGNFSGWPNGFFDFILMLDLFEHVRDSNEVLQAVRSLLKPTGYLLLYLPDTSSLSCRIMKRQWTFFIPEHLFSFSRKSIKSILNKNGFDSLLIGSAPKYLTAEYASIILDDTGGALNRSAAAFLRLWPKPLAKLAFPVTGMQMAVIARPNQV